MFGYKRPYSGKRGRYYTFGRPYSRYSRRGTIGRAAAGAAAAKRSDKTETYSCTVNGVCSCTLPANQQMTNIRVFHPYNGGITNQGIPNDNGNLVYGGAVNDRGFRMKSACYDEVKLDSMKVTLTPAQLLTNSNFSFTICTMWDRKASPKECGYVGQADWMANGAMPTALEIFNNEGTIKSIMTGNQIYGFKRYCKASSILEKGGYHDSSILYNSSVGESPLNFMYEDAWVRGALPFSPALFVTIYSPASLTSEAIVGLSYKVEYTFTFRNPKSDLDYFLTVEAPGYVNPDNRDAIADPNRAKYATRATPKQLNDEFRAIYQLKNATQLSLPEAKASMESLFLKPKEEDDEKDEVMEIEDDPGTA